MEKKHTLLVRDTVLQVWSSKEANHKREQLNEAQERKMPKERHMDSARDTELRVLLGCKEEASVDEVDGSWLWWNRSW